MYRGIHKANKTVSTLVVKTRSNYLVEALAIVPHCHGI